VTNVQLDWNSEAPAAGSLRDSLLATEQLPILLEYQQNSDMYQRYMFHAIGFRASNGPV
jgi:hypothetical protein